MAHPKLERDSILEIKQPTGTAIGFNREGLKRSNFLDGNKKAAEMIGGL
jgi:hypothetical protein